MPAAVFAAGRCAEKIPHHMIDGVECHDDRIFLRRRFVPREPSSATGGRFVCRFFLNSGDLPVRLVGA